MATHNGEFCQKNKTDIAQQISQTAASYDGMFAHKKIKNDEKKQQSSYLPGRRRTKVNINNSLYLVVLCLPTY